MIVGQGENLPERISEDFSFVADIKRCMNEEIALQFKGRVIELRKYAAVLENHHNIVDEHQRPIIFSQLSYGYRRASESLSWALKMQKNAKIRVKQAEAIAAHDKFYDFVESRKGTDRKVSVTEASKKWYTQMDEGVIKAKMVEAVTDAMVEQFSSLKFEFIQGQSTLKNMYYGNRDASNMNSATVTHELGDD